VPHYSVEVCVGLQHLSACLLKLVSCLGNVTLMEVAFVLFRVLVLIWFWFDHSAICPGC